MEEILKWLGIMAPIAFGAIGSAVGCMTAGSGLAGALPRTKESHGALIGMSAAPSSQTIYGLVLMMMMMGAKNVSSAQLFAVGFLCGIAIMMSAIMQGRCCAAGIRASVEDKSVYGKCWIPVGVTESFAVFALVFGIVALTAQATT